MRSERTPWTCRWSEYRPSVPAPLWLDQWMTRWACLVDKRRAASPDISRCLDCTSWEPRDEWQCRGQAVIES